MKKYLILLSTLLTFSACHKQKWEDHSFACAFNQPVADAHPLKSRVQAVIERYTQLGIPGISVAVYSPDGYLTATSGLAKIEDQIAMQPCHLHYSQSVAKTYMAVAILKMKEEGLIQLDETITRYLPEAIHSKITDASKITVRMLLNHTSGVPEYNSNPNYVSYLLQHPLHRFTTEDYLNYVKDKPLMFEPGTKHVYVNTNYELLALIGDFLTEDHARYIREKILVPHQLNHTFYRDHPDYLNQYELVNSYWDRYSNGKLENCTEMQKINVVSMMGDDGIIATPYDYIRFLQALTEKQILKDSTFREMLTFVKKEGNDSYGYGLGINREYYKGQLQYGHSGGGIGGACYLTCFPDKNIYLFIGINLGTSIHSPVFTKAEKMMDDLYDAVIY